MRTCDICFTTIPLGTDCCPNCGYRYRPEKKIYEDKNVKGEALKKEMTSTMKHHDFIQHPFQDAKQKIKKGLDIDGDDVFSALKNSFNKSQTNNNPKMTQNRMVIEDESSSEDESSLEDELSLSGEEWVLVFGLCFIVIVLVICIFMTFI